MITVVLCNDSIYSGLDELIELLQRIKTDNPEFSKFTAETENESDYYSSHYANLVVRGHRPQTKTEFNNAGKEAYKAYVSNEKYKLAEYEKLKVKYGD